MAAVLRANSARQQWGLKVSLQSCVFDAGITVGTLKAVAARPDDKAVWFGRRTSRA